MFTMQTERLKFTTYSSEHRDELISLFTDPEVMKHVGSGVMSQTEAEKLWRKLVDEFYPNGKNTIWAVFARDDSRYVGHAALRPRPTKPAEWEISYFLKRSEWGNGFATEIASRLVEFGFTELQFTEIFATIDDDHAASIRVAGKAGMKFLRYEFDESGRFSVYSVKK